MRYTHTATVPPVNAYCLDQVAWELYCQRRYREADEIMRSALECGLVEAKFLFHAGLIAYAVGRKDEALLRVKQALALDPRVHTR
ncbi:MAG: hypothetical protein SFV54_28380 [Bryobacteraceae bacterium]|nr:hypothetical protein [Bryobacteraceae bacterium]